MTEQRNDMLMIAYDEREAVLARVKAAIDKATDDLVEGCQYYTPDDHTTAIARAAIAAMTETKPVDINAPYENTLSIEELRIEVRRCWNAEHALATALRELPEMPEHSAMLLLNNFPHGTWRHVKALGDIEQRKLNAGRGINFEHWKNPVPYKSEYESAAGVWSIIRDALRKELTPA